MVRRRALAAALALLAPLALTSCAPAAKPITLRIVTDDDAAKPSGRQILHFAAEVERLSGGTVTVLPKWHAAGDTADWDQANAKLVMNGDDALGLIPSRAWDELGVRTLRPLTAPFLITTDAQVRAAVTGPAAKPMLAGLSSAGVTGISLWPESLRHPFGLGKPLLSAADWAGTIRTPTSETGNAVIRALGGNPSQEEVTTLNRGAESQYSLAPSGTIATADIVLFPKVNSLVANAKAWSGLTEDQRGVLTRAAAATRSWANRTFSDEAAAQRYCEQGGKVAEASAADLATLTRATRSVSSTLEQDAATRRIMRTLSATIGAARPASLPAACRAATPASDAGLAAMSGTWVVTTTADDIRKAGATSAGFINENAGTLVITFSGGSYSSTEIPQQGHTPSSTTGLGDLTERRGAVTVYWSHAAGENTTITPSRTADGRLAFTGMTDAGADRDARALDTAQFVARSPWTSLSSAVSGRWTRTVSATDLQAAGATDTKAAGPATLTLRDGRWTLQRPDGSTSGTYRLQDQSIVIRWPGGGTTTAAIGPNPEGGLGFVAPTDSAGRSTADRAWDGAAFTGAWAKR